MKTTIIKLFPLLLFFLLIVFLFSSRTLQGDESGYVAYATRLAQGGLYFNNEVSLWWGPGYPILLVPFVILRMPWLAAKLLNAFLLFGAILYFRRTLLFWLGKTHATVFTLALGLYPPFWVEVHLLLTESLVFFLICGFMFHCCKLHRESKYSQFHLAAASAFLGYLALTKVFFGYVIIAGLLSFLPFYLWRKKNNLKKMTYMYLLALVWCLPYLIHTYSLTGKVFYWGTSGGMSLYWMSTPYSGEFGDWFSVADVQTRLELEHHRGFFDRLAGLSQVERDNEFQKQAIYNIFHHPEKYLTNWAANIGRLLFSYPFSYTQQKLTTFFFIIPNMFIVVLFVLSIYPAILKWKSIPYEIYTLFYFALVAFGGTSLLSAYQRQFRPFIPILLLWLAFVYTRILIVQFHPDLSDSEPLLTQKGGANRCSLNDMAR